MRDGMQVATVRDGNDRLRLGKFRKVYYFSLYLKEAHRALIFLDARSVLTFGKKTKF